MLFNIDKCKVLHFGFDNMEADYLLGLSKLSSVDKERELGVIIDKSLKPSKQCMKAERAGNAALGMINRTFICKKNKDLICYCSTNPWLDLR